MSALPVALGAAIAIVVPAHHHNKIHRHGFYLHHRECRTDRCARQADAHYARRIAREAARRARREASEGWTIPAYVVECESHFQNEPPNSAGASGYYQIIPGTWAAYGGRRYASEAWLATRRQQGVVAAAILAGGGLSEWDCA